MAYTKNLIFFLLYMNIFAQDSLTILIEGFDEEEFSDDWTIVNNNNDQHQWEVLTEGYLNGTYYDTDYNGNDQNGEKGASCYGNTNLNDEWLITPQIFIPNHVLEPGGGYANLSLSFWARSHSSSEIYQDDFKVRVTTSSNLIDSSYFYNDDFEFWDVLETVNPAPYVWTNYSYDLSSYSGDSIFVAIQLISANGWLLFVDDILITADTYNTSPIANNQNLVIDEDIAFSDILTGIDEQDDLLYFSIIDDPDNGTVQLFSDQGDYSYAPDLNYWGTDSFSFQIDDGLLKDTGQVFITISPVNDQPIISDLSVYLYEDTEYIDTLYAMDVEGDSLQFSITSNVGYGILNINEYNGSFIYSPDTNYFGFDTFQVEVSDGSLQNISNVMIDVVPINDPPIAFSSIINMDEDIIYSDTLNSYDVENDDLLYLILENPSHGIISLLNNSGEFTFHPNDNFFGLDSFLFSVFDGSLFDTNQVSIVVDSVNDSPVASYLSLSILEDTQHIDSLIAQDVDEDNLTFYILDYPSYGNLEITNAELGIFSYSPNINYNGLDVFSFQVSDGSLVDSSQVYIDILPSNDAPVSYEIEQITDEDIPLEIILDGFDVDQDSLDILITTPAINGVFESSIYYPDTNYFGIDSFFYQVFDGNLYSEQSKVRISINPINDYPSEFSLLNPLNQSEILFSENLNGIEFSWNESNDIEGDSVTYYFTLYDSLTTILFEATTNLTQLNISDTTLFDLLGSDSLQIYWWDVSAHDGFGHTLSNTNFELTIVNDIFLNDEALNLVPKEFVLSKIFPNPFNPIAGIQYGVSNLDWINIGIYDIRGKELITLYDDIQQPGYHLIYWNASNYSSGIYFVKMIVGENKYVGSKKIILLK